MIIFLIDSLITFKVNNLHGLNKAYFCSSFHCVKRLWKQLLHKLLKYWSTKNKRKIFDRLPFVYKNVRIYLLYHSRPWVKKNVSFLVESILAATLVTVGHVQYVATQNLWYR